jgi:pimeloyl-ACP methyl ester carboxylesterase
MLLLDEHSPLRTLFRPSEITRTAAVSRTERMSAATHLVASLEHLARPASRDDGGFNNWAVCREGMIVRSAAMRKLLDVAARRSVTTGLHVARVASAVALLSPLSSNRLRLCANATLATSSFVLHPRHHYGTDGSDQVSFLVQSLTTVARAGWSRPRVVDAALWGVGLQATLSYAVSGWVKLTSRTWRCGGALSGVTRTVTYGERSTWKRLNDHPRSTRALETSLLALECTTPVVYALGGRLTKPYVAGLTAMHLGIAKVMGLGRFVPSFCSMHPSMLYTTSSGGRSAKQNATRSDEVAGWTAVGALAIAAVGAGHRSQNRRIVEGGRGDERSLTTSDGNSIAYRRSGLERPDAPVFVLESGLLSTADHWAWIADELAAIGTVVTYHRPGYGSSTAVTATAMDLDDLVTIADELLHEAASGRPVVLVGHSLGGYLSLLTASRTAADVRAVVLVDSSHPDELRRSERQRIGAEHLRSGFERMAVALKAGSGVLLPVPAWVESLPREVRRTALAHYRDARMWQAACREWDATVRAFRNQRGVPSPNCPVLALTAEQTRRDEEVQYELHAEMAAAGASGQHVVIDGADHDSVLTNQGHAKQVAACIAEYIEPFVRRPLDDPPNMHSPLNSEAGV